MPIVHIADVLIAFRQMNFVVGHLIGGQNQPLKNQLRINLFLFILDLDRREAKIY
jgi:hypothetical protein